METKKENNNIDKLMQAQTILWSHILKYIESMCLKCAVELGIPRAIHMHGKQITINELLSSLSISHAKKPHMYRLMRMLCHSGIFTQVQSAESDDDRAFTLTPVSTLLVDTIDVNLYKFSVLNLHPTITNPFQSMSDWFKSKESPTTFHTHNSCGFWEMTEIDSKFNELFNEGMASDAKFLMHVLVKEQGHVFDGVKRLVDVGGGTGSASLAISEAFSDICCIVLDCPQVVDAVKEEDKRVVEFIAGDMFDYIPPADAIFLKSILHDWDDEECVRILKRCKEAIVCSNNGGKVIIIDQVIGSNTSNEKAREAGLYFDMLMMVLVDGAEREEKEWSKIFMEAEFKHYKITPALGNRCIIELYPF